MYDLKKLDWDTQFFGFGVGSFSGAISPEDVEKIKDFVRLHDLRCVYWFADAVDAYSTKLAHEVGFRYVDTRQVFHSPIDCDYAVKLQIVDNSQFNNLRNLARTAHVDSRFYFDRNFDLDQCSNLYQRWLDKSHKEPSETLLTIDSAEGPVGYVTVALDGVVASIGLIAVHPEFQRKGYGKRLVLGSKSFAAGLGAKTIEVATQARNLGAQNLYIQCGFSLSRTMNIFHWWPNTSSINSASGNLPSH